jgi:hypothetical protein
MSTVAPVRKIKDGRKRAAGQRGRPQQFCLFGNTRQTTTGGMPIWTELPDQTRSALTDLMTQLILDHAERQQQGPMIVEASHDL